MNVNGNMFLRCVARATLVLNLVGSLEGCAASGEEVAEEGMGALATVSSVVVRAWPNDDREIDRLPQYQAQVGGQPMAGARILPSWMVDRCYSRDAWRFCEAKNFLRLEFVFSDMTWLEGSAPLTFRAPAPTTNGCREGGEIKMLEGNGVDVGSLRVIRYCRDDYDTFEIVRMRGTR